MNGRTFVLKYPVVNLVDVGEIVLRLPVLILVIQPKFILKYRVEAHIFEVRDLLRFPQIVAITFSQRQRSAPGSKHFFPEVRKGMRRRRGIDFNGYWCGLRSQHRLNHRKNRHA